MSTTRLETAAQRLLSFDHTYRDHESDSWLCLFCDRYVHEDHAGDCPWAELMSAANE